MRALVACERIGGMSAAAVGGVLGTAWADLGVAVAVAPVAVAGEELRATVGGAGISVVVPPAVPEPAWTGSSAGTGVAALAAARGPGPVAIDLTGARAHDGGAGMLSALGATADVPLTAGWRPLTAITALDLERVRLRGTGLLGVVDATETDLPLCGLRGISSAVGRALGVDPAEMLAADAALAAFAAALGIDPESPGAGAGGGAGAAVLALGGRLVTGPQLCAEAVGLESSLARADLLVAACPSIDIGNYGGPAVRYLAELAARAEVPMIAFSPVVAMGGRELRTLGVEAAYPLPTDPDEAAATAARVAAGWVW